jgi:hypothetical protein
MTILETLSAAVKPILFSKGLASAAIDATALENSAKINHMLQVTGRDNKDFVYSIGQEDYDIYGIAVEKIVEPPLSLKDQVSDWLESSKLSIYVDSVTHKDNSGEDVSYITLSSGEVITVARISKLLDTDRDGIAFKYKNAVYTEWKELEKAAVNDESEVLNRVVKSEQVSFKTESDKKIVYAMKDLFEKRTNKGLMTTSVDFWEIEGIDKYMKHPILSKMSTNDDFLQHPIKNLTFDGSNLRLDYGTLTKKMSDLNSEALDVHLKNILNKFRSNGVGASVEGFVKDLTASYPKFKGQITTSNILDFAQSDFKPDGTPIVVTYFGVEYDSAGQPIYKLRLSTVSQRIEFWANKDGRFKKYGKYSGFDTKEGQVYMIFKDGDIKIELPITNLNSFNGNSIYTNKQIIPELIKEFKLD